MPGTSQGMKRRDRGLTAVSLLLALLTGGCASGGGLGGGAPSDNAGAAPSGLSGKIERLFAGSSAKGPQTAANAQPDVNCPPVEVRNGAATYDIGSTADKSAMTLKYQGEFAREARDCAVVGGNMVMNVGVQGRVIVGPAGGPGQVEMPLRIAVVEETPGGTQAIMTKFIPIPVTIAPNAGNVPFTHIEEALTFPLPTPTSRLDNYIVYIGFDPQSAEALAKPPPKVRAKRHRRPKPHPAASAN